jgi:hypothetical protein
MFESFNDNMLGKTLKVNEFHPYFGGVVDSFVSKVIKVDDDCVYFENGKNLPCEDLFKQLKTFEIIG